MLKRPNISEQFRTCSNIFRFVRLSNHRTFSPALYRAGELFVGPAWWREKEDCAPRRSPSAGSEISRSRVPFGQAPSLRPGYDLQIFFPIFFPAKGVWDPANPSAFWVHGIQKAARIADGARRPPSPLKPILIWAVSCSSRVSETKCDGDFDSNSGAPTVPDGQIRTKSLLAGIT